jgi:phosphatidate cytidylyltransferase
VRLPEGLWLRVATAVVLLGGFLAALLLLEARQLAALLAVAVLLAGHEWGRLAGFGPAQARAYAIFVAALFGAAAYAWFAAPRALPALFALSALFWLILVPAWLRRGLGASGRPALSVAGIVVLVPTGMAVLSLPPDRLLLLLGLVWIADTAAYLAGRAFGRRLLAPTISPGKTWEGVAGALAATFIYAIICAMPGAPFAERVRGATWVPYLAGAVLLCALSIVGDLFESALKRRAGAKDSGRLLPGHGGILDRVDSMTASLPIAALLLPWLLAA